MHKKTLQSALIALASISGCATQQGAPTQLLQQPPVQTANEMAAPQMALEISEPSELTLAHALALTLERNPELKSFAYSARIGEARIIQSRLIPNPELSVQVEDAFGPFGNDGYSQVTLQLSQIIELGGKRAARIGVAKAFRDQLQNDYEIKRVEVLSDLTDKFIRAAADEQLLKILKNGLKDTEQALEAISRRAKAGGVSELEEIKAKVLVARLQIASDHAEHELQATKKELAAFWGEENPKFTSLVGDLFEPVTLPSFEELSTRIAQSPEIRKWAGERRIREAEKKLADSRAIPNLTLGAGPRWLDNPRDQSWVLQFGMPLNIFDRNQGGRMEAEALFDKAAVDISAATIRLKTLAFALYQEAKHAQSQLDAMKQQIIPQAENSLKVARRGYEQGSFSYLDLVDAQRTQLEVAKENIEAAYSLHSFTNSIERLIGAPINDLKQ